MLLHLLCLNNKGWIYQLNIGTWSTESCLLHQILDFNLFMLFSIHQLIAPLISWVCNCTHANLQIPLRGGQDQLGAGRAIMKTLDGDRERKTRVEADKWGVEGSRVSQWDSDPNTITIQMWKHFLCKSALINWTISFNVYKIFKLASITTFGGRETLETTNAALVSWGLWVCRRGSQLVRNKIANKAECGPRIICKLTLLTSVIISAILKLTGDQLFRFVENVEH